MAEKLKTEEQMSDTPAPAKRRGLSLPPRGQALSRLQDLEADQGAAVDTGLPGEAPSSAVSNAVSDEVINAVNTASSNAVTDEGSVIPVAGGGAATADADAAAPPREETAAPATAEAPAAAYRPAPRPPREPTTRITVDMPDSLHRQISVLSAENRRSIKELVIEALETTYFGGPKDGR